ncbi:MAG: tRNA (N(6)-L-threonylcarbamoyladenosine(37)-C(2))-methylthiotransferase MtaB [Desulfitobacteriaceae bacterium]|nr:tRNA (N(6)-L-threonylcarbamoyladenosine(37)-C(2))-methylthiotransferase MtaB [Desulfitobacteriaceae bacterium]MDD4752685.1 tRNA (N(6)-L-threonylcarbamoyladenosine(37)-C(2))-methylthiotransferase MtaB [Desulfitobacteriaceae bacterium]
MASPKVAVYTLGCKVNQNETEAMAGLFKKAGYEEVDFHQEADVYIINTCSVTHLADRKSRQMIRRAIKTNPDALVAVTGCYAQTAPGEVLNIPGVDLIVGTSERNRIVELVNEARLAEAPVNAVKDIMKISDFEEIAEEEAEPHRVRAYLKIQEGCNRYCSYCIIPYSRGPIRSRPIENVVNAAQRLVEMGYKEIVLTGIHTGAYGTESGNADLAVLIRRLLEIEDLKRLRISSIDPNEVNEELLDLMAGSEVLCRHLHIPLQSGDDRVLERMNRVYTTDDYENLVGEIRTRIPGIAITSDIMVGFPGETEEEFQHTLVFTEKIGFSALHVFKYSPRRGTPAAGFPKQVDWKIKEERSKELISLGRRLSAKYAETNIGKVFSVLVEQETKIKDAFFWEGHTDNYLKVVFPFEKDLRGSFTKVFLGRYSDGVVYGQHVSID